MGVAECPWAARGAVVAEDFEAETKSRGEELQAIAKAKEVITDNVGSAEDLSYGLNQALAPGPR